MTAPTPLYRLHLQEFVDFLKLEKIRRFYFVYDPESKRVSASDAKLQSLADFIETDKRDFMGHEGAFFQVSNEYDTLQGAFVHRTVRGAGAGGVRYWQYTTVEDYLRDGLRLSKGMTRKNALAGLWWGGGKGVMAHNPAVDKQTPEIRKSLYQDYGRLMTSVRGCYVTAEDAGTNVEDMANIFSKTRFTTCIPPELGGSGNPSIPTARGIICGLEAALEFAGMGSLQGKVVAVQGLGNVGGPLVEYLFEKEVARVIGSDIDIDIVSRVQEKYGPDKIEAHQVAAGDNSILSEACDIVAPCATGAILNPETIPRIKAKIVCGAANNQLEDTERDDDLLFKQRVIYVPDFLTNRMGIVNCANEQYGYVNDDPFIERHLSREWHYSIYQTAVRVLMESRNSGVPPARVAVQMADELSKQPHPFFGHRGKEIIRSLVADGWHQMR
jgi:glutamate dehydrogenase/leucine dehydrogenase